MNNIYSERLVGIDRLRTVCAPHLLLLRIHFPALMKEIRAAENLLKTLSSYIKLCSFESVSSFLLSFSEATHIHEHTGTFLFVSWCLVSDH